MAARGTKDQGETDVGGDGTSERLGVSSGIRPNRADGGAFDPLDFLAEVSAHIPDAHEKTTLFYGWYSNRTRGYRKQHGLLAKGEAPDPVPGTDHRARLVVRRSWRA